MSFGIDIPRERPVEMTLKRTWKVEEWEDGDALLTCGHCKNSLVVHLPTWRSFSEFKTSPCPYCFRTGKKS